MAELMNCLAKMYPLMLNNRGADHFSLVIAQKAFVYELPGVTTFKTLANK